MSDPTVTVEDHTLELDHPFEIARGESTAATAVVVRLEAGGHVGIGGAGPARHYGETAATVQAALPDLVSVLETADDLTAVDHLDQQLRHRLRRNPAAHAAVEIALEDLRGKRLGVPLYRLWGLDPTESIRTSYTIGIDPPSVMADRAAEAVAAGFSVLKVKLGTADDEARIAAIREAAPEARIRVDANEAWDRAKALRMLEVLAAHDVEFVEQPVPAEHPTALEAVYDRSPLPIAVDESCETLHDVPAVADKADIINIKLMKAGGLTEARRMIATARAHGLETMVGCMTESNASIAAAAHLAPLLDYADLDGSLLLAEDPYDRPARVRCLPTVVGRDVTGFAGGRSTPARDTRRRPSPQHYRVGTDGRRGGHGCRVQPRRRRRRSHMW